MHTKVYQLYFLDQFRCTTNSNYAAYFQDHLNLIQWNKSHIFYESSEYIQMEISHIDNNAVGIFILTLYCVLYYMHNMWNAYYTMYYFLFTLPKPSKLITEHVEIL